MSSVPIGTVTIVLDASAAAAVVFREAEGLTVAPHLFRATRVVVPQLFHLELANVARTKVLRGQIDRRRARRLLRGVSHWPLEVVWIAWERALRLGLKRGLTAYAAAYLRLARDRRVRLVTLDRALRLSAGRLATG